jgi:hypothetical protein
MIEIGKTYCRRTVFGFRYACVTKIDLFSAVVYYDTTDVSFDGVSDKEFYKQSIDIEDFIQLYLNN